MIRIIKSQKASLLLMINSAGNNGGTGEMKKR